jgi:hypothetical protein
VLFFEKGGTELPRKGYIAKREILPDPIYKNKIVTKFINQIMLSGKKVQLKQFAMAPLIYSGENRQGCDRSM